MVIEIIQIQLNMIKVRCLILFVILLFILISNKGNQHCEYPYPLTSKNDARSIFVSYLLKKPLIPNIYN